ncbi:hypothetical protein JCM9279_000846 [Rhodotorula babjevae]
MPASARAARSPSPPTRTWTVFSRERIHRIVFADPEQAPSGHAHRAVVVGGKEAVLVHLDHDGADLEVNDHVLISTLHNTIHVFALSPSTSSTSRPRADFSSSPTRPLYSLDAPQRPTLWCTRFDRPHYRSAKARGEQDGIRLAGGSLWGDTFLWDVGSAAGLSEKVVRARALGQHEVEAATEETLRRLAGHKGAVFTAAFSPCTRFLVTGSDDRTLRIWNLALLPPRPTAGPSTASPPAAAELQPHLTLWGHSARVWRAVFLAPAHVPPPPSSPLAASTADTVVTCTSPDDLFIASVAEDGTARAWRVSSAALEPSAVPTSSSSSAGDKGYALVATFRDGHDGRSLWAVESAGSFTAYFAPSLSSTTSSPSSPLPSYLEPFYVSTAYGGPSSNIILRLVPSRRPSIAARPDHFTLLAFSNRGGYLRARLSSEGALLGKVVEAPLDVRPALVAMAVDQDERERVRVAAWDHAAGEVALLEVDLSGKIHLAPLVIAKLALLPDPPCAPTALRLLTPSLLLVGTTSGSLELYSAPARGALERIGSVEQVHAGGVADLCARIAKDCAAWTITSVRRDGARGITRVEIVSMSDRGKLYLGHVDSRTVLLDHLGQQIYSFDNSSKKLPTQLVGSTSSALRFYRIVSGQSAVSSSLSSAPIIRPGLHGREIRALEVLQLQNGRALLATAAENGVMSVSELRPKNHLEPVWTARHLPSALKALAWSPRSGPSSSKSEMHTLFVCGTQELLQAYTMSTSSCSFVDKNGELGVLSAGQVIGSEGAEVRAMDLAVAPVGAAGEGRHLVVVGYSDGSLRAWTHDTRSRAFTLLTRSSETSKCILLTRSSAAPHGAALPTPFFKLWPHQSGVNALALSCSQHHLLVATGGDDNAVSVTLLELFSSAEPGDPLCAQLVDQVMLADAHASSIQGLDFLSPTLLASSSVEQRLNVYTLSSYSRSAAATAPGLALKLRDSTPLDVADCCAQAVLHPPAAQRAAEGEEQQWKVLVAGIGVEVVDVGGQSELE